MRRCAPGGIGLIYKEGGKLWNVSDCEELVVLSVGVDRNESNYFMYRWADPVRSPSPHSSCSGHSCLMKIQKSPMNRQQILPQQWLNSRPEIKKDYIQQDECVQNMMIPTYY